MLVTASLALSRHLDTSVDKHGYSALTRARPASDRPGLLITSRILPGLLGAIPAGLCDPATCLPLPRTFSSFFFFNLFLAALDLCCCEQAFSSCSEQGRLSSCGAWAPHCSGFPCCGLALEHVGSVVATQRLSYSVACGNFPGQELNPCALHWQANS